MMWLNDLLMLFFPVNCLLCGKRLPTPREVICLSCELKIPRTGYTVSPRNPVHMGFWGRIHVEQSTSLFRFEKGSSYQSLLHDLKYRGNRRVGMYLGRLLGHDLKNSSFAQCDVIVPVPIHPKRQRQRGYNQSEIIARGVADILQLPVEVKLLRRKTHRGSQTFMGRYERFENVLGSFDIAKKAPPMNGKTILLIDDVVTTGATLEACCQVLFRQYRCRVYIATVCCA
jgi:ComF family protein